MVSTGDGGFQGIFVVLFVGAAIVIAAVREKRRQRIIRGIAQVHGFVFLGSTLLKSFPFSKTSMARASSVRNAIAGDLDRATWLIFDCRFGTGKHGYSQTVVAVKGAPERLGFLRFDMTLVTEGVEDWTLVYRRKELLLPEEIETLLSPIS